MGIRREAGLGLPIELDGDPWFANDSRYETWFISEALRFFGFPFFGRLGCCLLSNVKSGRIVIVLGCYYQFVSAYALQNVIFS